MIHAPSVDADHGARGPDLTEPGRGAQVPVGASWTLEYEFEWDPPKARLNRRQHRVTFERAATVFLDPRALSIADEGQASTRSAGSRWAWMYSGALLVAVHTFEEIEATRCRIRLISARKATRREIQQYNEDR
jgi:hypothetical protein